MDISNISKTILFKSLTEEELSTCLKSLGYSVKDFKKGETIMYAGNVTDSSILFLNIGHILDDTHSGLWKEKLIRNILRISAGKNLMLSRRSFHISKKSARDRILSYLNTIALQKHSTEFDIPFDRQQLADYLNLERTNMSKELGRMKAEGLIDFKKNHFEILTDELE